MSLARRFRIVVTTLVFFLLFQNELLSFLAGTSTIPAQVMAGGAAWCHWAANYLHPLQNALSSTFASSSSTLSKHLNEEWFPQAPMDKAAISFATKLLSRILGVCEDTISLAFSAYAITCQIHGLIVLLSLMTSPTFYNKIMYAFRLLSVALSTWIINKAAAGLLLALEAAGTWVARGARWML